MGINSTHASKIHTRCDKSHYGQVRVMNSYGYPVEIGMRVRITTRCKAVNQKTQLPLRGCDGTVISINGDEVGVSLSLTCSTLPFHIDEIAPIDAVGTDGNYYEFIMYEDEGYGYGYTYRHPASPRTQGYIMHITYAEYKDRMETK